MKLAGKVALVTGSSQGIGQSIAERLAAEGADIVVNYHSHPEEADAVKANIEKLGRRAVSLGADLGTVAGAQKLVTDGVAGLGQIDLLVNNAGVE
jgi:glucose 1-dehydrogenase